MPNYIIENFPGVVVGTHLNREDNAIVIYSDIEPIAIVPYGRLIVVTNTETTKTSR